MEQLIMSPAEFMSYDFTPPDDPLYVAEPWFHSPRRSRGVFVFLFWPLLFGSCKEILLYLILQVTN